MSRPRTNALFELGEQWIANEPPSPMLFRFWYDTGTGRTRRESLRTEDLEEAKLRLAELILKGGKQTTDALLSVVLEKYASEVAEGKPSEGVTNTANTKMLSFWGENVRISALVEDKQKEFAQSILDDGFSIAYVTRILSVLHAAVGHARISHEVIYSEAKIRDRWKLATKEPRRAFVPTDAELARVLNAEMPEGLWRWMLLQMATAGRPQTAIDLKPDAREREAGTVNLNPIGRMQNKKYHPIVREPRVLTDWLDKWETGAREQSPDGEIDPLWRYCGYTSIEAVKTYMEKLRIRPEINLPRLTTYSFRHKVTTVLRRAKATHGVTEDDISAQLGHRRPHLRTTAGYGEWDPSYLQNAAATIDDWFVELQRLVKNRELLSQNYPRRVRVRTENSLQAIETLGAGEANRTPDPNLGNDIFPLENPQESWIFTQDRQRTDREWDTNRRERNPRNIPDRRSQFAIQQISTGSSDSAAFRLTKATRHRKSRSMASPYNFRPLAPDDLPTVARWLETPEVLRWWGDSREQFALIAEDLNDPLMDQWFVEHEAKPFAYLQAYPARAWPQTHLAHLPATGRVIDVFVGDPTMIGCGHGRAFLREFAEMLIADGASLIATDPLVENHRARRAYSRAGFVENRIAGTADGLVAVMTFERCLPD